MKTICSLLTLTILLTSGVGQAQSYVSKSLSLGKDRQAQSSMRQGGADAGGGNLCYIQGKPVLLELADLHGRMNQTGIRIEKSVAEDLFGFGSFHFMYKKDRLKEKIDQILRANESTSPIVVSWFRRLILAVPFSFVSADIKVPVKADTSLQAGCQQGNVRASAIYLPEGIALVDRNKFNSLDLDSQAGLVLHEGARLLQLIQHTYAEKYNKSDKMTNLQLQALVRHLFDVFMGHNLPSLDTDDFINSFYFKEQPRYSQKDVILQNVPHNIEELGRALRGGSASFRGLEDTAEGYLQKKDSWFESQEVREAIRDTRKNSCNIRANLNEWLQIGAPASYSNGIRNFVEALTLPNVQCSKVNK